MNARLIVALALFRVGTWFIGAAARMCPRGGGDASPSRGTLTAAEVEKLNRTGSVQGSYPRAPKSLRQAAGL
jgi:hypothetical protein